MQDAQIRLEQVLRRLGPHAIAVSGGVDSMTLAYYAHRVGVFEVVHAVSPAVPPEATARVQQHALLHGWRLTVTRAREFEDANYLANPVNRCFFCKSNLYDRIAELTALPIASGANLDDLGDYRPGLLAAADRKVVHPLIEAEIGKAEVRALAALAGLDDLSTLPAQPCLSSRIETGISIDPADLDFVRQVEKDAADLIGPDAVVRCRITGEGVVLELGPDVASHFAEHVTAVVSSFTQSQGRRWAGTRSYQRGSAFIHDRKSAS